MSKESLTYQKLRIKLHELGNTLYDLAEIYSGDLKSLSDDLYDLAESLNEEKNTTEEVEKQAGGKRTPAHSEEQATGSEGSVREGQDKVQST